MRVREREGEAVLVMIMVRGIEEENIILCRTYAGEGDELLEWQ